MKRRNSFAPHLPKPALLPLLVLLALPPCTSQAGFLQEFYDDANLQSSYTAPGLYASASMDTVTGGRFILKANREDFQPYYLQGPELKAGCGGIDVFLGAFSIPSKDEFVSFLRSIGTALPGLAFHAALQSLAPDLNEQISQFRDMLMRYASMLGDSCQVAENIMNAGPFMAQTTQERDLANYKMGLMAVSTSEYLQKETGLLSVLERAFGGAFTYSSPQEMYAHLSTEAETNSQLRESLTEIGRVSGPGVSEQDILSKMRKN